MVALTAVLGVLPGILLQEGDARQVAAQPKVPVREALQQTLRCDPFMRISAAAGLNMLGLQMVNGFGTYVLIYHVFGGDMLRAGVMSGIQYAVSAVIVLLLTPSMVVLGRRVGKRRAFELSMLCGVAACVAKWFCYTPSAPWLVIAIVAFTAPATTMSVVFANSMVADVCAYEAKRTGLQLEGTYMAVLAWIRKFSMALSALASGFMLNLSGFEVGLGSHQSSGTVLALRLFFSFFPVASYLASWWLVRKYELPEVESSTR